MWIKAVPTCANVNSRVGSFWIRTVCITGAEEFIINSGHSILSKYSVRELSAGSKVNSGIDHALNVA